MPKVSPVGALMIRGSKALFDGQFSDAIEIITQAIAESRIPMEIASCRRMRAHALSRSGELESAVADYDAILATPEITTTLKFVAHMERAIIFSRLDQDEHALADFAAALPIEEPPGAPHPFLLMHRAILHEKMHRPDLALSDLAAAQSISRIPPSTVISTRRNYALHYIRRGQFNHALAQYEKVLASPDLPLDERASCLGTGVTWCHYSLGDFPRAIEAARGAVALHPAHRMSRFNLAICLLAQGDHVDESLDHYRTAAAASISREQLLHDGLADLRRLVEKSPALAGAKEALALLEARLAQLPEHSESEH